MTDRTVKVTLTAQVAGFIQGMQQAAEETKKTGSEAEKLAQKKEAFKTLGTVMLAVGGAITAVGLAAAKTGIEYNTLQQRTRAGLTTMLGSAQAANAQMDKLDAFAKTSPFAKQVFIQAQQQMLAFGIETKKVIPYLGAVQDAVAAAGGSNNDIAEIVAIMSKIQSSAKITAVDLMQFGNHGLDAATIIGSAMGKTGAQIRQDITDGALDATVALDALAQGMNARFGGAAANVKQTYVGALDRVKAAWRDFSSELMTPLVNPNGGGALVDLLNWTADMMRAFQKLPEPVKNTTSVIVLATGAILTLGGAAILAIPKIAQFKVALATLEITGARSAAVLRGVGAFLMSPWGIALAAGALSVDLLAKHIDSLQASSEELANALTTAKSAADVFRVATKGMDFKWLKDVKSEFGDLNAVLNAGAEQWKNVFARFDSKYFGAFDSLKKVGTELANIASTDAPKAAAAFSLIAKETDGTHQQLWRLIAMMPDYRAALEKQATQLGINISSENEYANQAALIKLAQNDMSGSTLETSQTLAELSGTAVDAKGSLKDLADAIKGFGGGQLAVNAAQRDFMASIDAVTEGIKKQQEEYKKAHDTLNGWTATLDLSTKEGRDNSAALDGIAKSALITASAIVQQTGSQEDASKAIADGREALIKALEQFHVTGQAAEDYANKLGLIPGNIDQYVNLHKSQAEKDADALIATLNRVQRNIDISVRLHGAENLATTGGLKVANANGSILDFYGRGGIRERHVAQIAPAGAMRVWAEPETGGEAYIPLAASKRARSLQIWQETGMRLGVNTYGDGGFQRPTYVSAAALSPTVVVQAPASDRPIYTDSGAFFGMLRETAQGVARLEIAADKARDARSTRMG